MYSKFNETERVDYTQVEVSGDNVISKLDGTEPECNDSTENIHSHITHRLSTIIYKRGRKGKKGYLARLVNRLDRIYFSSLTSSLG